MKKSNHTESFALLWLLLSVCSLLFAECIRTQSNARTALELSKRSSEIEFKPYSKLGIRTPQNRGSNDHKKPTKCHGSTESFSQISPRAQLESIVLDVVWAGIHDSHLFLLTLGPNNITGGKVWISHDSGDSFEDMTERFTNVLPQQVQEEESSFGVVKVFVSKSDAKNIFFQGAGRFNWLSSDSGSTVRAVRTPGRTTGSDHIFKIHPTVDNWTLALVEREVCDDPYLFLTSACAKDLFLTMDLWNGHLWTNLTETSEGRVSAFVDFEWGEIARQSPDPKDNNNSLPSRSVLATVYQNEDDVKGPFMGWDKDIHFVESDDFFATPYNTLVHCGSQFEALPGLIFLGVSNACPVDIKGQVRQVPGSSEWLSGVTLYISSKEGRNFTQACVRVPLEQAGYTLALTHDGEGAFLIVQHLVDSPSRTSYQRKYISNLYASGDHASLFSLSLPHIRTDPYSGVADFSLIRGLPGAYIANKVSGGEELGGFETKITYNGGVSWESIPAPSVFTHDACDQCTEEEDCYLHLYGASSWRRGPHPRPSVYSHQSAPGLITGVGIVGTQALPPEQEQKLCTWLSSDGGVTWKDIAIGAFISEFGDYGGFVLITRHASEGPTNEALLSTDEGQCWRSIPFQEALEVDNIRMEPDGQRPRFLIHGNACLESDFEGCGATEEASRQRGVVYTLDVQDLVNFRKCDASDYIVWEPLDNKDSTCLLGSKVQIEKRRRLSQCLNGADYERRSFEHRPCECSEDDVMCDFGYKQTGEIQTKNCTKIDPSSLPSCPVIEGKEYVPMQTGKRLVHNTECHMTSDANSTLFYAPLSTQEGGRTDSEDQSQSQESTSDEGPFSQPVVSTKSSSQEESDETVEEEHVKKRKNSFLGVWVSLLVLFAFFVILTAMVLIVRRRALSRSSFDEYDYTSYWDSIAGSIEAFTKKLFRRETPAETFFVPLQ